MQTGKKDISGGRFLGHSANADGAGVPELLHDHLRRVAEYAARFCAAFGAEEQGHAAGLLHDLPLPPLGYPTAGGLELILRDRYAHMFTYTFFSRIAAFHANRGGHDDKTILDRA